jgi:hypothetical protein
LNKKRKPEEKILGIYASPFLLDLPEEAIYLLEADAYFLSAAFGTDKVR